MAGQIAGELANELGDGDETDQPLREPGVGTPTMREPADAIGPAAEGGESVNSGQVNDGAADIAGPEGMDEHLQQPGDEQPRRRRRRRGGRRHRRRNGGENGAPQGVENAGSAVAGRGDDGEDDQDEERAEETGEPLESAADSLASGPVVLDAEVAEAEVAPEPQPVKAPTRRRRGAAAAASAAAVEPVVDEGGAGPAAEEPRKRAGTRSRGGTRAASTRSRATSKSAPQRIPPKAGKDDSAASAKPAASAPVVRTGSADKHLVADEPVIPQPLSRPRSYRDLDAIPDDYD
jgi:ribonuclease E